MTTDVSISADANGRPLEVLADLIAQRQKFLKGETTENAVTATTINIVTSLRSSTKKAPLRPTAEMYRVTQVNGEVGWRGGRGARVRRLIVGGHRDGAYDAARPVQLLKGHTYGKLFRVEITNPNLRPNEKAGHKNPPVYLVMAPSEGVAITYAKERLARALKKESGMAKYALGIAQAKVSNRPMEAAPSGSNQFRTAFDSAHISKESGDGKFSISVKDSLRYSMLALKGGSVSFNAALMKAANRTAAIINKLGGVPLDQQIPTPFPEVTK